MVTSAYEWPTHGGNNYRTSAYGEAIAQATSAEIAAPVAYRLALSQNVPNPFLSGTAISFVVPREQDVSLKVFNVTGRLVRTLLNGPAPAGPGLVRWDGRDNQGQALSSGIYFYRLNNGEKTITRKGVLLR